MPQRSSTLSKLTAILVLLTLLLISCTRQIAQTPDPSVTDEPIPTKEIIPVFPKNAQEMVIFSYEEDGYAHLFAYIPGKMPLTRITSGDWDDITPSPSPNGEK